uniref:Thaumatin-like protein n=1 Tax=Setaria viridis TaxID=4556 RepID=A0A4U6VN60_SETVI|nr:hypothetical protein SEVIR_3G417700v2 [Setaria viridis]
MELAAFAAGASASAATFTVTQQLRLHGVASGHPRRRRHAHSSTVPWPDVDLRRGCRHQPAGVVWGRTGCFFNNNGRGRCQSPDRRLRGRLSCALSGQPPLTLAEFTLGGAQDFYDISVIDGYNLAMAFSCCSGDRIVCTSSRCPQAYLFPEDNSKVHACAGNSNYQVTFCP